jgi:integrase/recombinase XerD
MTNMQDVHNQDHRFELNSKKFNNSEHVSDENKEAISKFCDKCFAEGLSKARVKKYITNFHTIFKMADSDFKLEEAEKEELESVVAKIERSDYSEATKSDFKTCLKKYYKLIEGNGRDYPDKVKFFDTHRDRSKMELPEILEKEQIEAIIDACKNDRDRAMYKILYEGGIRAGELMSLRIKDVKFNDMGVKLNVRGKTGNRQILLVESERYLRNWLSKHPFSDTRDAPLWVKVDGKNIEERTPEAMKLKYEYMRINLKRKATDAGIRVTTKDSGRKTSEVYPHLFRHTRATHLATELTEAAMKEYFGWTQNSDMPQRYIHLSGRDIDNEIMKMYGLKKEEKDIERECPRCYRTYKGAESFCPRCGAPLDRKAAINQEEAREAGESYLNEKIEGLDDERLTEAVKRVLNDIN